MLVLWKSGSEGARILKMLLPELVAYFYPEAQCWVLNCNLRTHNCWISLSEETTQPNEVG